MEKRQPSEPAHASLVSDDSSTVDHLTHEPPAKATRSGRAAPRSTPPTVAPAKAPSPALRAKRKTPQPVAAARAQARRKPEKSRRAAADKAPPPDAPSATTVSEPEIQEPTSLRAMCAWIESVDQGPVYKYFSRWSFERLLDKVARELAARLTKDYRCQLGCSILYRVPEHNAKYVLGGSSRRRTLMDPSARYYDTNRSAATPSLTARALLYARPLGYNDFADRGGSGKDHKQKSCELPPGLTKSYLAIPRLPPGERRTTLLRELADAGRSPPELNGKRSDAKEPPTCLLRFSFADKGYATPTLRALLADGERLLEQIFTVVEKGLRAVRDEGAMAIADLNSNLLRFHSEEYKGLDELAFHLQTLFDGCECSVFLAHPMPRNAGEHREVRLHLAATSALSNHWPQHKDFRAKFFEQNEYYACLFDGAKPASTEQQPYKTERAYYEPDAPQLYVAEQQMPIGKFTGKGEFACSTSFLAVAIPPPVPQEPPPEAGEAAGEAAFPYGVIRLVRGKESPSAETPTPFSEKDKDLAAAIAKTLRYWLDFFPRNHELEIDWAPNLKDNALRTLFAIDQTVPHAKQDKTNHERTDQNNEIEFIQLLRKVFCKSQRITIKKQFAGYSGAVVLLVQNDSGLDLILKVAIKGDLHSEQRNLINQEVDNYRQYVEGKLSFNHNVIYPELIQETRRINGFATSFIGSGHRDRLTLKDYVKRHESPAATFATIARVVERIVQEVWGWWYRKEQQRNTLREGSVQSYLVDGLCVPDWYVLTNDGANVGALDSPVLDARARHHIKNAELPSTLWSAFQHWRTDKKVEWYEAVTHGDLHCGNIFFDPMAMDVWVIDFARTGWRTAIFDLAVLENNIKLFVLSTILHDRQAVQDYRAFLGQFYEMELLLAKQTHYETVTLPRLSEHSLDPIAHEAILGVMKVVSQIRLLLHQVIGRSGSMLDYQLALYALTHRYMGVRGASDDDTSSLQILMAYESVQAQLDVLAPGRSKPEQSATQ